MSALDRPLPPIRLILLMCGAEIFSMAGFAAYTTLLPALQREWTLSNSEAGLISGIFFAGYVVVTPVLTSLTDRVDARRIYLFACLLSILGAVGFAFLADGLITALFFQSLIGAGLGGSYMPGLKMLTDQLEGSVQSRGVAFYTATFGIGSSTSIYLCGLIEGAFGWHSAFVFGAAGPVLAAFLVNAFMPRGRTRSANHPPQALLDFRPVLRNRATLAYVAGYSAHNYELFG